MSKNTTQIRAAVVREKGGPFNIETQTKEIKKLSPMETDQQPEASAVLLQTLTSAVSDLKNRLQRDYEQAYPGLGNVVRIVLDEEEERAWDLSSFPQLLLPDLVEAHMERLGLQPVSMRHDNLLAPAAFVEIESDSLSPAYVDCPSLGGYVTGTGPRVGCPPPEGVDVAYPLNEPATRPSAPTKPRVLVVYAHPNPKSYTHAVLEAVQAGLGERCEVQTLDLYATGFDPVLVVDETRRRRDLDQVEETRALREQLAWCDAMLFVYPVWWGGFPAMLKGYLDRTFVSGLTYSFEGRPRTAVFPHGLMRDKEAHFFYTLDSPWLVALLDPGWFSNLVAVLWYCGFRRVRRYYLARLKLRTDEQRARWLVTVREHAGRIAERLPGRAGRVQAWRAGGRVLPRNRGVRPCS